MGNQALVTGGTGFIGHNLANELESRGYQVTVLDNKMNNYKFLSPRVSLVLGNIKLTKLRQQFDVVYHLAALRSVSDSFFEAEDYISTNIWGTQKMVQSFPNARFVFASSSTAAEPKSIYGITKRAAEDFVSLHSNSVSIRFMNIFGERQTDKNMEFPAFCHALKNNKKAILYGDEIIRDYMYVHDLIPELIRIGESKLTGTTDTGYGEPISILNLYKLLAYHFQKEEQIINGPERIGDMAYTCSSNRLQIPKYGFECGLSRTVEWYKKYGE